MSCSVSPTARKVIETCMEAARAGHTAGGDGALFGGWTWAAVVAAVAVAVSLVIAFVGWRKRAFDKTAAQLQPFHDRLGAVEAEMETLEAKDTVRKADFATLTTLRGQLRDDARRWPDSPLGEIDGLIEKYVAALSEEHARPLWPWRWRVSKKVGLTLKRCDIAADLRTRLTEAKEWIERLLTR
ncbi:hypothetical protein ACFTZ8_18665 [Streptomyces fungicidicus]|uniref:Uncharacterized protein n=1 Tax=Streptomyces griseoflavus Tu4000 TaxID=467200 RepID=D9Y0Z9_9ACTN|nr:hypothetical protein [Streptomyces griseoflavus]EFL37936.1 hypothetical protein SSRG_00740 [Streptomyces griseoflavus Tu4000]